MAGCKNGECGPTKSLGKRSTRLRDEIGENDKLNWKWIEAKPITPYDAVKYVLSRHGMAMLLSPGVRIC